MIYTFSFCLFFIAYVYFIYPIVLIFLARNKAIALPRESYKGDVSIVMVVCNEEENIEDKLKNLMNLHYQGGIKKIIVVDDGSDDKTAEIIKLYVEVTLLTSECRLGKANGLNLAMECVDTELVMFVDCRQTLELNSLEYLTSWFKVNPRMGAVSGELVLNEKGGNDFSEGMDGYWKYEKLIRKTESIIASVPGVTGALYVLRTKLFEPLPINTLLDDVQIPMVAAAKGYKVGYDERAIAWDVPSTSADKERQRKIRTLGGNYQLLFRFPMWILPRGHPIWWQFLSHKIARLLAPIFAIIAFSLSGVMYLQGSEWAGAYMVLFITGILVAPLSLRLPAFNRIPMVKLLAAFVTLNWFCLLALVGYLNTGGNGLWKK